MISVASRADITLSYVGWISAALVGLVMPSFVFLMGDFIDAFADTDPEDTMKVVTELTIIMVLLGVVMWLFSYLTYAPLIIFSEAVGYKTRVAYLEAILK